MQQFQFVNNNNDKVVEYLNSQYHWTVENKKYLTPTFFIQGFEYPKVYQREWLIYYIPDLLEDADILDM